MNSGNEQVKQLLMSRMASPATRAHFVCILVPAIIAMIRQMPDETKGCKATATIHASQSVANHCCERPAGPAAQLPQDRFRSFLPERQTQNRDAVHMIGKVSLRPWQFFVPDANSSPNHLVDGEYPVKIRPVFIATCFCPVL